MNNFPIFYPPINNPFINNQDELLKIKEKINNLEERIKIIEEEKEKKYLKKDDNYYMI